jgi:hypothetical protein
MKSGVALKIICVAGTNGSGKSSIIRKFTAKHLRYAREPGDVLGIFPRPYARSHYAVGVSGIGDTPESNLTRYRIFDPLRWTKGNNSCEPFERRNPRSGGRVCEDPKGRPFLGSDRETHWQTKDQRSN